MKTILKYSLLAGLILSISSTYSWGKPPTDLGLNLEFLGINPGNGQSTVTTNQNNSGNVGQFTGNPGNPNNGNGYGRYNHPGGGPQIPEANAMLGLAGMGLTCVLYRKRKKNMN